MPGRHGFTPTWSRLPSSESPLSHHHQLCLNIPQTGPIAVSANSMAEATDLPNELLWQIVQHLEFDPPTLAACALVGRSWYLPAQVHQFRRVSLKNNLDCSLFSQILAESAHLAQLVRALTIQFRHNTFLILSQILPLLSCVESLDLQGFSRHGYRRLFLCWHRLPIPCVDALAHLFRLPSLKCVNVTGWCFRPTNSGFPGLFRHSLALQSLGISDVMICKHESTLDESNSLSDTTFKLCPPRLQLWLPTTNDLSATNLGEWLFHPECSIDIRHVRELLVSEGKEIFISQVLCTIGASLEVLTCSGLCNLSHNPRLRVLDLKAYVVNRFTPPQWLETSISSLPPNNCLEALTLTLEPGFSVPYSDDQEASGYLWKMLSVAHSDVSAEQRRSRQGVGDAGPLEVLQGFFVSSWNRSY
ncbi:hypothetical protein Hypma_004048 [Hypsizygus marmoreus]|uniref:F-box domain-containing protein n=1 Tax=Hypsizygus marmoreus TaxID=39966 RepID=A0A369J804_HYPMA|nr:hypothetical protein Hypma_004048 [Hypsizygus marmoreus]